MNRIRVPLVILVISACVAVLVGFASGRATSSSTASVSPAVDLQNAFVSVYRQVSPSVVQIQTSEGLGSGIVFDAKGDIVTNYHVVGGAKTFTVTTSTGKRLKGTLVGSFPPDDLAVIKVSRTDLSPASFADSSKLRVGELAIAIGNPLGLQSSVTQGLVSALGRQEPEGNGVVLQNAIQTSAAINPGNSGGAVVNSGRPYLGVRIGDTGNGAYIGTVSAGGPAAKAGLKAGDVVVALNGKPTPSADDLGTVLAGFKPGQTVTLKVVHQNGRSDLVKVTLGEFPGT
jgi:S1-C subfamily serine protease